MAKIENRQTTEKINKVKSCFFEKIHKLPVTMMKEKRKHISPKSGMNSHYRSYRH